MKKFIIMPLVFIAGICFGGDGIKKHSETEIIVSPEAVTPKDQVISLKALKNNLAYLEVLISNFESGTILNRVKLQAQKSQLEEQINEAVRLGVKENDN